MKKLLVSIALAAVAVNGFSQGEDPILMKVNGQEVTRSEFEYSFNKNNTEGVIDRKSLDEYVDLFVNYKLKVAAAQEALLDTATAFKKELADYRAQQAESYLVDSAFIEQEARKTYDLTNNSIGERGLFQAAHILIRLKQDATAEEAAAAKVKIDSIYGAIQAGADFEKLAQAHSEDPGSASQGGVLPWLFQNQTLKEFEEVAFSLQPGEMSQPFLSPVGYHIIKMVARKPFEPYEFHRESIYNFLNQRGIQAQAKQAKGEQLAAQMGGGITPEEALAREEASLDTKYPDFGFLMKEYHDGSLLYEISTREVWDKAAKDEAGLEKYFKKHKKNYNYEEPVFRGIIVHCKSADVLKEIKKSIKKQPQDKWVPLIREQFNNDSVLQVKIVRGPFKQGKNKYADFYIFKQGGSVEPVEGFPVTEALGKLQKKGPDTYKDVRGPVTADYQSFLEGIWVKELRAKYPVVIYEDVLKTVNNHN